LQLARPPHLLRFWLGVLVRNATSWDLEAVDMSLMNLNRFLWHHTAAAVPASLRARLCAIVPTLQARLATAHPPHSPWAWASNTEAYYTVLAGLNWLLATDPVLGSAAAAARVLQDESDALSQLQADLLCRVRTHLA
jgi:hypothetical protein